MSKKVTMLIFASQFAALRYCEGWSEYGTVHKIGFTPFGIETDTDNYRIFVAPEYPDTFQAYTRTPVILMEPLAYYSERVIEEVMWKNRVVAQLEEEQDDE